MDFNVMHINVGYKDADNAKARIHPLKVCRFGTDYKYYCLCLPSISLLVRMVSLWTVHAAAGHTVDWIQLVST